MITAQAINGISSIAIRLSQNPARLICGIDTCPEPNTMAFGGVATGSIKAQLAAIPAGTMIRSGSISSPTATAYSTGTSVAVVAVLLVNSVRKIIMPVTVAIIANNGKADRIAA